MAKRDSPLFPPETLTDPVLFTEAFLKNPDGTPFHPHPGQIELLRGIRRYTVVAAGRQWGKSHAMGAYAAWFGSTRPHRYIWVIAPSLDQARIIFDEIAGHFRREPLKYLVKGKIKDFPFPEIELVNGSIYHARGANSPQYIRGNRSHLSIIDEAAHMKDNVITGAIEPMMTVTGKEPGSAQIMISTPFGPGAFANAYENAQRGDGVAFHYTSLDNPHADLENLERIKRRYGEDSFLWRTEYLAELLPDDMSVFPWNDVRWAYENYPHVTAEGHIQFPYPVQEGHRYLQGVDLANQRDFFVSAILDASDRSAAILVRYDRWQRRGYTYAKSNIRHNWNAYNHARTLIDATTLAESVVEDLVDIRAEGYKFTGTQAKYDIVQELARSFSEHRLRIPQDRVLLDELRYFAYSFTPSKKIKIEASEGHDDTVMALALANHLLLERRGSIFFMPVRSPGTPSFIPRVRPKLKPRPSPGEWVDPVAEAFKMD
jgi:phage terminase large subunit-like protein